MGFPSAPKTQLGRTWRQMQHFTLHIRLAQGCRPQHLSAPNQEDVCILSWMWVWFLVRQSWFTDTHMHTQKECSYDASKAIYLLQFCLTPLPFLLSLALFVLISFHVQPPGRQVKVYPRTTHHFPHMPPRGGTPEAWGKGKPKQLAKHCRHHHLKPFWWKDRNSQLKISSWIFIFLLSLLPFVPVVIAFILFFFYPLLSNSRLLISISSKVYVY